MPQPSRNATVPRQFRLGADTLERLDRIAAHWGLTSRADAIRVAAKLADDAIPEPPTKTPRKPRKARGDA